jgi:3-methyladenine DNA glycosylase AlkC
MDLLTGAVEEKIQGDILDPAVRREYGAAIGGIAAVLAELYANIPAGKRISYGRVHTVKVLAGYLHPRLAALGAPVLDIAAGLYEADGDPLSRGVALGILSLCGLDDYRPVLPFFEAAAAADDWETREIAQMLFRKLIKKHPAEMKAFLLRLVEADDARLRRFVGETLRPVQENRWFYAQPDYSLAVLRRLFRERVAYPRTSVGNGLSDLARRLPELVYGLVEELVASSDKNSYWIAYRACRNLVKRDPIRVMDLLHVDEYRYKTAVTTRSQGRSRDAAPEGPGTAPSAGVEIEKKER